jgi:peptidylamidoglycolate lyase
MNLPKYELIKDWPQLPKNFPFSQVTAVGVDKDQNILIFQRTGREWSDPFPDAPISSDTIFVLDRETGNVLNSWGANLFIMPHSLTIDEEDNIWITDVALHQVFKFSYSGELLFSLGEAKVNGDDSTHFSLPTDVAVASDGSFYVSDGYGNSRIVKFSREGKWLFAWGKKGAGPGEFNIPHGVSLDSHGNVFVADRENNRIQKFDPDGKFLKEWKNNQADALYALAIDNSDNIFAVDDTYIKDSTPKEDDIIQLDSELNLITRFGRSAASGNKDSLFHDIEVDKSGNIYVANMFNHKVQKFKAVSPVP